MCGILFRYSKNEDRENFSSALKTLSHRGPDNEGVFFDGSVSMGHKRLAILDLSVDGNQPMHSESGRYVIVYNGEVYNYGEIAQELGMLQLAGKNDTAVILAAVEKWGIEIAVQKFIGMFAFCLFDRKNFEITLVRDRFGVKPLYFGWVNNSFIVSSELKPIVKLAELKLDISHIAMQLYTELGSVPAPYSIYEGVYKLLPGTIFKLNKDELKIPVVAPEPGKCSRYVRFWSVKDSAERGKKNQFQGTLDDAVSELDKLLKDSVRLRLVADVPLGAFLSGGIDSSTVVALMQSINNRKVKTYSIGNFDKQYDEAPYAAKVADYLGCDHSTNYISDNDAIECLKNMAPFYDEPFSDYSQIPTYLISKIASSEVKVALSGDGGDELFLGYTKYQSADQIWPFISRIPLFLRRHLNNIISSIPVSILHNILPFKDDNNKLRANLGERLHRFNNLLGYKDMQSFSRLVFNPWNNWPLNMPATKIKLPFSIQTLNEKMYSISEYMSLFDAEYYIPDDLNVKVDRASMAHSLEVREPLLDHRIFEFAYSLPQFYRAHGTNSKLILKKVLEKYLPAEYFTRPKRGFSVPLDSWLRGSLKSWAYDLLSADSIKASNVFEHSYIEKLWSEHLSGKHNWVTQLWRVLAYQSWYFTHR